MRSVSGLVLLVGCATSEEAFLEGIDPSELALVAGGLSLEMHVTSDRMELLATGAPPLTDVYFARSDLGAGPGPCPVQLGGLCVDVATPASVAGRVRSDANGKAFLSIAKPPDGAAFQAAIAAGAASDLSEVRTYTTFACQVMPANNPWNTNVSAAPLHANSADFITSIGRATGLHPDFGTRWAGAPNGIPFVEVNGDQDLVGIQFAYAAESDPGPYPIPSTAPIEGGPQGGGDRHVIVVDRDNCELYESWNTWPVQNGNWAAGSGATFDLSSNALRPEHWTSADAAGLPIYPGLVKYEEVASGVVNHALRFTISDSQDGYIHPATHSASSCSVAACPDDPPMGLRLRMRANYNCSGLSQEVRVLCTAMKTYGMFVADNGSDWYISGAPDPRWNDNALADLSQIPGDAFEAVDTGPTIQ